MPTASSSTISRSRRRTSLTRVGRARSTVANTLRLLELNSAVQDAVVAGAISEGHARAIGGLPTDTQAHVVAAVIEDDLSVRQTEELVRRLREPRPITSRGCPEARRRPRCRTRGGGPAPIARHEGSRDPHPARRADHDRVLRRRGARAALPAARRGCGVTERARATSRAAAAPLPTKAPATKAVATKVPATKVPATKVPAGDSGNGAGRKRKGAAGSDYTAESIQVLEGLEAVRRRPGMYIGSTDARGLHHLVWEVVDNSIDEAMAGHARTIRVTIQKDGTVEVVDDGRGVPVGKHRTGKDALEVVHTVLHAGGKFGGGGYKVSGGLHGVGVSVVNALSEWLRVETARDGSVWAQEYKRGKPLGPVKKLGAQGDRRGTRTRVPRRSRDVRDHRVLVRDDHPATARVGVPHEGRLDHVHRRASGSRAVVLLRGRPPVVRPAPQPEQGGAAHPPDLRRATRGLDDGRGRAPVQRHVRGDRARVREQHQHGRRRHARHRLPGRADELAERLGAEGGRPQGVGRQPLRRRRAGGPHGGHQREADRPPVRGPDEGQARQCRGEGPGPDRR